LHHADESRGQQPDNNPEQKPQAKRPAPDLR
jgi:hypothetical protein